MAESSPHDVALNNQSVGDNSPSDALATATDNQTIGEDVEEESTAKENGDGVLDPTLLKVDDQILEDGAARSDTDTSRANSVVGDGKASDTKPVKKFVASKPVSFAKYSVPKTNTVVAPLKVVVDKAPTPTTSSTSSTPLGRPRLVAKTTSSTQQKLSTYKPVAPDPMQVWNKNRATPQPSTKHLTDEELKQQYGIHLTSRLQSDSEGKEAKWADIDDDEDDWAPETIEWNDGTKTTVTATDHPISKSGMMPSTAVPDLAQPSTTPKQEKPQYPSSVGPNAIVLRVGASVERQQAQRALAQQSKGPSEKQSMLGSKASPAPAPAKSPWAKLPEVDKVSPIAINPQPLMPPPGRFPSVGGQDSSSTGIAASPAKEMSADEFNRSWRNSPSSQTKELFIPSSGRYEAVSDGKRRMSKNEQSFRAPAVLQRPNQRETRAPAEPSPAFQTRRTSIDQGRRRASSSISGGSGQFARRMSFKSSETINLSQPESANQRPLSREEPSPSIQTPTTYQARGPEYPSREPEGATEAEIEAQKVAQKALMKEKIEKARQRKIEEEQRLEAEKQERIRLKLASLGPPPEVSKAKHEETAVEQQVEAGTPALQSATATASVHSPPKPPQPTGEPQQYGMMKVHPLDNVKKVNSSGNHLTEQTKTSPESLNAPQSISSDKSKIPSPTVNGVRSTSETSRPVPDDISISDPSPKLTKSIGSLGSDARTGWTSARHDHRSQQAGNLWGLPNNKALGNGTFDQSLAGYSPQDLSRTSSTGQGWLNGRTPTVGQSPQLNHVNQHVPETRSHLLQNMISPDSQPLTLNSEIDPVLPTNRPAPIGRPQAHPVQATYPAQPTQNNANGYPHQNQSNLAAWNNFGNVARIQEKADTDRFNREFNERREEEQRTGVRQQAPYSFNETFKQVHPSDHAGQRHVTNIAQSSQAPSNMFGAVGSSPANEVQSRLQNVQYGQLGRGSRFFPQQMNNSFPLERRAVTYSHPETSRSPSPPPAEEYASYHPAFDGSYRHPKVHFPREKAVVRLPPAASPSPPPKEPTPPLQQSKTPLTWAARASMPAPVTIPIRTVSSPLVSNPSWQERFNGLLFPKQSIAHKVAPTPALASSREPLDIVQTTAAPAAVSLPTTQVQSLDVESDDDVTTKDVEHEEDLFEDREAGSIPTVCFPRESLPIQYHIAVTPRILPAQVDPNSIHMFMVNNWSERYGFAKPQYAVVKAPGNNGKGIKRDLPVRNGNGSIQTRTRNSYSSKHHIKPKTNSKSRVASKAH